MKDGIYEEVNVLFYTLRLSVNSADSLISPFSSWVQACWLARTVFCATSLQLFQVCPSSQSVNTVGDNLQCL